MTYVYIWDSNIHSNNNKIQLLIILISYNSKRLYIFDNHAILYYILSNKFN